MATVSIAHNWGEDECTVCTIDFDDSFPDAMQRAVEEAWRGFALAMVTVRGETDDE